MPISNGVKIITTNKYARSSYDVIDKFEAGLVLTGPEIKSIRAGQISLKGSYGRLRNGELWLTGAHIAPYHQGTPANYDPLRPRKLLLHKREANKLLGKINEQRLTLLPLAIYLKHNVAKLEIALARGLKKYDKRAKIKAKETDRDIQRKMRSKK
ncbi:SsrA-binding protein SmpB [Patescibacteria group bacterium]|nr:SsrA-binding protein SmpB [Patescibacteria group bacterium]